MTGHQAFIVECNVDDMNPELSKYISSRLFSSGAVMYSYAGDDRPAMTISVSLRRTP
jgi:uncharacterized protein (DUF111 family)